MKQLLFACALTALSATPALAQSPWIVGGSTATQGQFPWVGNIIYEGDHYCGASLISPRWAITAGHCTIDFNTFGPIDLSRAKIRFNNINTAGSIPAGGIDVTIKRAIPFPVFNINQFEVGYDIALLELQTPVTSITPISLPAIVDTAALYATGNNVKIAGWGLRDTFSTTAPNTMKWCATKVYDFSLCDGMALSMLGTSLSRDRFCAGYKGTEAQNGAAAGDSGGPIWKESGTSKTILGVVSGGFGNTTLADLPGMFTKVAVYRHWIDSVMATSTNVPGINWTDEQIRVGTSANNINLSFQELRAASIQLELYQADGRKVYQMKVANPSYQSYTIPTSGMPAGLYILRITDNSQGLYFTRKLANVGS